MQGALFGRGSPAAETNIRGAASCFGGRSSPAPRQAAPVSAAGHGRHLHSLSESGPGQSRTIWSLPNVLHETKSHEILISARQMLQHLAKVDHQLVFRETLQNLNSIVHSEQV